MEINISQNEEFDIYNMIINNILIHPHKEKHTFNIEEFQCIEHPSVYSKCVKNLRKIYKKVAYTQLFYQSDRIHKITVWKELCNVDNEKFLLSLLMYK
jgi:hypothetical protein